MYTTESLPLDVPNHHQPRTVPGAEWVLHEWMKFRERHVTVLRSGKSGVCKLTDTKVTNSIPGTVVLYGCSSQTFVTALSPF